MSKIIRLHVVLSIVGNNFQKMLPDFAEVLQIFHKILNKHVAKFFATFRFAKFASEGELKST